MDTVNGRPGILKQANLSMVRNVLKNRGTATRAEIAAETNISSTTVRSLLTEMMENGEIQSIGYDESSGGRKAERYQIVPDRYFGAALCTVDGHIDCLLVNVNGEIVETAEYDLPDGDLERALTSILDALTAEKDIKSIGIGVPGVVDNGSYWKKRLNDDTMHQIKIGETISKRYQIPVVLENDLNATAIGFGRCYAKEFPDENPDSINLAYLHFNRGCVSAGFIADGRIIRGANNFAGELGLVPLDDDQLLDERMSQPMDEKQYINNLIKVISWVCGILNPQYIALVGPEMKQDCIGPIVDGLSAFLPQHMMAEILYSPDMKHDYFNGMAYLTAGKMFEEVQLIKE